MTRYIFCQFFDTTPDTTRQISDPLYIMSNFRYYTRFSSFIAPCLHSSWSACMFVSLTVLISYEWLFGLSWKLKPPKSYKWHAHTLETELDRLNWYLDWYPKFGMKQLQVFGWMYQVPAEKLQNCGSYVVNTHLHTWEELERLNFLTDTI